MFPGGVVKLLIWECLHFEVCYLLDLLVTLIKPIPCFNFGTEVKTVTMDGSEINLGTVKHCSSFWELSGVFFPHRHVALSLLSSHLRHTLCLPALLTLLFPFLSICQHIIFKFLLQSSTKRNLHGKELGDFFFLSFILSPMNLNLW